MSHINTIGSSTSIVLLQRFKSAMASKHYIYSITLYYRYDSNETTTILHFQ